MVSSQAASCFRVGPSCGAAGCLELSEQATDREHGPLHIFGVPSPSPSSPRQPKSTAARSCQSTATPSQITHYRPSTVPFTLELFNSNC